MLNNGCTEFKAESISPERLTAEIDEFFAAAEKKLHTKRFVSSEAHCVQTLADKQKTFKNPPEHSLPWSSS
ncbi:hypothetical protein LXL04_024147 [Taraxacum kok-saghyz]